MKNIDSKFKVPSTVQEKIVHRAIQAQMAALNPDGIRITLMHSEIKKASYNLGKGEGPKGPSGAASERFFTADEVAQLVPFLIQENGNRRGYNIFITPMSDRYWYILLDDITQQKMAELEALQLKPQIFLASSPQRYQGIYLLPKDLASKDEANTLFRLINARHGDLKISGLIHPFRFVGLKNRKPKYKMENGHFPFSELIWSGKSAPDGLIPLLDEAKALMRVIAPKQRKSKKLLNAVNVEKPVQVPMDAIKYANRHYNQMWYRYGKGYDKFLADFMLAKRLLAQGLSVDRVAAALLYCSPEIHQRCGGKDASLKKYVTKTVLRAESGAQMEGGAA